jgi:Family of unknown function (DUF5871)
MEFGDVIKVPDGRFYLKVTGQNRVVLKNVPCESFEYKPLSFHVSDVQRIKELEQSVIEKAKEKSEEWFGRSVQPSVIEKAFQSSLSGDMFDTQLARSKGKVVTTFWDAQKKMVDILPDGTTVDMIVELSGVWFLKKSFGPIFTILQVKESKQVKPIQYLFEDDPEDEIDLMD